MTAARPRACLPLLLLWAAWAGVATGAVSDVPPATAAPAANSSPILPKAAAMPVVLPAPLDAFVAAVNRGDADAALAFFGADGVVDDWGRRYVGADAIRAWSEREFVGAGGRMSPTRVARDGERVVVDAGWASRFYSGDSRFVFTVDGARIVEMRIVGH